MGNLLKIPSKAPFYLYGKTVFEKVIPFSKQVRLQISQTLFSKLTVTGATKIHSWIDHFILAVSALSGCFILEEFYFMPAMGTINIKNIPWFPISRILTGAFHKKLLKLLM
jgi:hypothetical protein